MAGVTGCSSSSVSLILIMVVTIALDAVAAQSTSPSSGCTSSLITLTPCLGYVTSNVSTTPPSQSCCTALSSVVKNNAACLCLLLSTNNPVSVPINTTRALSLPGACKVATPPVSQCKAAGAPAPSLSAGAPGPSSFAVPSKSAPTASIPTSSPAPATSTPQAGSPTASVGGISPTESEQPKESAGTHFTSSTIINFLVGIVIVSIVW